MAEICFNDCVLDFDNKHLILKNVLVIKYMILLYLKRGCVLVPDVDSMPGF